MKNYLLNILITGGQGQLSQALTQHAQANHFKLHLFPREKMDITDCNSTQKIISQISPDIIINTAAYTAVDKAEKDADLAMLVNYTGAKNLAIIAESLNIPLIHLSTDYVFDGQENTGYQENDKTNPINVYGLSKLLGENAVKQYCEQHIILRVSGIFSEFGNNFFKTIRRLAQTQNELRIVADQITCPTYAGHIASVIYSLVEKKLLWGTYHYCDTHTISWYDFACLIIQEAKLHQDLLVKNIIPITSSEYLTPAKRPLFSVLNCNKITKDYNIEQFQWINAIKKLSYENKI